MFTGIIEAVGKIRNLTPVGGDLRLTVEVGDMDMSDVQPGDSIGVFQLEGGPMRALMRSLAPTSFEDVAALGQALIVTASAIAIGWPAESPQPRTRYREDAVHNETW